MESHPMFNEWVFRRGAFHENKCLNSCIIYFPVVVSARLEMRVRGRKRTVKVDVQTRQEP